MSGQETFYCLVLSFLLSGEFSKLLWKIRKEQKIVSIWNVSLYGFTEKMK